MSREQGAGSGVIINNSLLPPNQPISLEIDNSGGNKLNSAVKKKVVFTSVFYDTGNKEVVIPSSIKITDKQRELLNKRKKQNAVDIYFFTAHRLIIVI